MYSTIIIVFILTNIIAVFGAIDDMKIYPTTDMPEPMRRHALGAAMLFIESETNVGLIAKRLANEMNTRFGHPFVCLVGDGDSAINIEANPQTTLSFSYEKLFFTLFKAKLDYKPIDAITEARDANITIEVIEMDNHMQELALDAIKLAIKLNNDFEAIAKNISSTFDIKYGFFWHCFVSQKGVNSFNTDHINGTFITITVAQLKITLFRTHGQESLVDLNSMIEKALNENPVIIQKKATNENVNEIIEIVKQTVREQLKTCKSCYQEITTHLIVIFKQKYQGGWEVAIGVQDSCDADFYRDEATFYLDFTLGKLLTRISKY